MASLQLNDDGSVGFPLRQRDPSTPPTFIELPEPSARELAQFTVWVNEADNALTAPPTGITVEDSTAEQLADAVKVVRERTLQQYSDADLSPHGQVIIRFVKLLTDIEVTVDDLPGWAMNPRTCNMMLNHFQDPLHGRATGQ